MTLLVYLHSTCMHDGTYFLHRGYYDLILLALFVFVVYDA